MIHRRNKYDRRVRVTLGAMNEPYTTDEVVYLAFRAGWRREGLQRVPAVVFSDWCRDQGWEKYADRLQRSPLAWAVLRDVCRTVNSFGTSLMNGEMEHEERTAQPHAGR